MSSGPSATRQDLRHLRVRGGVDVEPGDSLWIVKVSRPNVRGRGGRYALYNTYKDYDEATRVVQELRRRDDVWWAYVEERDDV